jgi:integrative and conjugative element protein (TIGR02256 family)
MNIELTQIDLNLKLNINDELMGDIYNSTKEHHPKEIGGILLGYYSDNGKCAYIESIVLAKFYINSPTNFTRQTSDLNHIIDQEYIKSQGKLNYLGEWHSHPDGSTQFSAKDFLTMKEIAFNNNVKIHNPILLIVSYNKSIFDSAFYLYHELSLLKYELN